MPFDRSLPFSKLTIADLLKFMKEKRASLDIHAVRQQDNPGLDIPTFAVCIAVGENAERLIAFAQELAMANPTEATERVVSSDQIAATEAPSGT